MDHNLDNKVALVTGGGSGIGRATALAFARAGSKVIVSDIDANGGQETVKIAQDGGGEAAFVQTDVSKADQVASMVEFAVSTYGKLDIAFNNAGVPPVSAPLAEGTEEDWDRITGINLKGIWLSMKHEIPEMLKQSKPVIVNTSSVCGLVGIPATSIYSATKFGIIGLTKTAALEYAQAGLRVNAICPGFTRTPAVLNSVEAAALEGMGQMIPIGRLAESEEVANTVVWLCSDAATYVSGETITIDGAYTAA